MKTKIGNGKHCRCHSCKELQKTGATLDPTMIHKWFILVNGVDKEVSEKGFYDHIQTVKVPERDDLAEVIKS
jgi:hypothetical protein